MSIFDILTLFGGLAMFLYGMRLMGDGLKESSSGTLKQVMEQVTNNPVKAFLLGVFVTALIQSSTATIVITSGLVAAGIITLKQSLGIIVGSNVGTTVTGQIIRLLDVDSSASGFLRFFQPSTLAPVALIIGIIIIMGMKFKNSRAIGNIAIGFGILFSGLLNMTGAVNVLSETGVFDSLFTQMGTNPLLGYLIGLTVAFILQSSSATIGILQAISLSGLLSFNEIYAVIVGVYLGDCVTTAIVCSIGAKADAKRVGIVNILYNLSKSAMVLIGVFIFHKMGLLDSIWFSPVSPGSIANTNTIFNLACAILLFPLLNTYERLSHKIVSDDKEKPNRYQEELDALSPAFVNSPALALRSCYVLLLSMFQAARKNIDAALSLSDTYDSNVFAEITEQEDNIDLMADRLANYLALLSAHLTNPNHVDILNNYYKIVNEFERLGDYAMNIAETGQEMHEKNIRFSESALSELKVLQELMEKVLDRAEQSFRYRDIYAAETVEPLEEVVDDMVMTLREHHMDRLFRGECSIYAGKDFIEILGDVERISDLCSNVALATLIRVNPELADHTHDYTTYLHSGKNEKFNNEYDQAHKEFFDKLEPLMNTEKEKPSKDIEDTIKVTSLKDNDWKI